MPYVTSSTIDRIVIAWSTAVIVHCVADIANSLADRRLHNAKHELTAELLEDDRTFGNDEFEPFEQLLMTYVAIIITEQLRENLKCKARYCYRRPSLRL